MKMYEIECWILEMNRQNENNRFDLKFKINEFIIKGGKNTFFNYMKFF